MCDVYDALRTKRPYRDAWESETVFKYLLEHSGTEFDPDLVKAFIGMMQRSETHVSQLPEVMPAVPAEANLS